MVNQIVYLYKKIYIKYVILLFLLTLTTNINSKIINKTNELLSYLNYRNKTFDISNIIKKKLTLNSKSFDNEEYNITFAISSFKLMIKVDLFQIPIISFENIYTLKQLSKVNKYFRMFDTIEEVYDDLILLFENDLKIINYDEYIELITYISHSSKNITFIIPIIQRDSDQKIDELFSMTKDLKNEIIVFNNKINECLEEIPEIKRLKNFNVLLISEETNSLLYNLLQTCPYINEIYIFKNDFIIQKFTDRIIEKFKIIIFDLTDVPYRTRFGDEKIKEYISKGGNIIFTHNHWMNNNAYQNLYYSSKVTIVDDEHPVFSSYYNINTTNNFEITQTHCHNKLIFENEYLTDVVIRLNNDINSEYLMIKNYEIGKLIYWNVGHLTSLTGDEEKLLVNLISYIYQDEN